MPPVPPSFGSQDYWEDRFTANPNPFEWLEPANILDAQLVDALKSCQEEKPKVLHIGCGTSLLSFHLRAHVEEPEQIHNLDYSSVAIGIGKRREIEIFGEDDAKVQMGSDDKEKTDIEAPQDTRVEIGDNSVMNNTPGTTPSPTPSRDPHKSKSWMRWYAADLLDASSLLSVCKPSTYSILVDKSTVDSISCGEDIPISFPYPLYTTATGSLPEPPLQDAEPIHPLHVLAIHLALIIKPGGRWISLSYSEDRFPFFRSRDRLQDCDDVEALPQEHLDHGFPDPGELWRLESKTDIQMAPMEKDGSTYRPSIRHWVYVLVRTDVEVRARDYWLDSLGIKRVE
jgi:hypothetical protein